MEQSLATNFFLVVIPRHKCPRFSSTKAIGILCLFLAEVRAWVRQTEYYQTAMVLFPVEMHFESQMVFHRPIWGGLHVQMGGYEYEMGTEIWLRFSPLDFVCQGDKTTAKTT